MNSNISKLFISLIIIIIGVIGRFALVSYVNIPNLEIITSIALISGIYLGGVYAVAVPLSIIFLSDLVIGNTYIFIFTWTAFAIIGIFGFVFKDKIKKKFFLNSLALGIVSSVFFYIYTNFGWWLMSGMYEYSLSGFIRCYYMAIPFFRNNLIGNLIFVPLGIYVVSRVFIYNKNLSENKKLFSVYNK